MQYLILSSVMIRFCSRSVRRLFPSASINLSALSKRTGKQTGQAKASKYQRVFWVLHGFFSRLYEHLALLLNEFKHHRHPFFQPFRTTYRSEVIRNEKEIGSLPSSTEDRIECLSKNAKSSFVRGSIAA